MLGRYYLLFIKHVNKNAIAICITIMYLNSSIYTKFNNIVLICICKYKFIKKTVGFVSNNFFKTK